MIHFVDIGRIFHLHCLNFIFINFLKIVNKRTNFEHKKKHVVMETI
jgi:hypothetical protein